MASPTRDRVPLRTRPRHVPRDKGIHLHRLRIIPHTHPFTQLIRGHAEIFGAELAEGKSYLFALESKAAVFTWKGCTIQMSLSLRTHSPTPTHPAYTSPVAPPQSMSQMRPQCPPMQTSTSPSSRCVYAPSATSTDPLVPMTINTQLQIPQGSSF